MPARGNPRITIGADASGVDRATRQAQGALGRFGKGVAGESKGIVRSLAGPIAGLTSIAGAAGLLKSSVGDVESLAKGTALLARTTGMDTKTSSEWVSVAKVRG